MYFKLDWLISNNSQKHVNSLKNAAYIHFESARAYSKSDPNPLHMHPLNYLILKVTKFMCAINFRCIWFHPLVGKSTKAPRNRHLSARYFTSTTTRLTFSPEYSNCERQSRENTRRKFPAASLLEHIAGISMCHQHQQSPGRANSYLSVTPTPFPTFRRLPPDFIPKAKLSTYERW